VAVVELVETTRTKEWSDSGTLDSPTLENSKCVKKKCENLEHFFSIYYLQGERPGQQSDLNTLCNIL
jgi:hypothetical protein